MEPLLTPLLTPLPTDILFSIALMSPAVYRTLQLASKSFYNHLKGLTEDRRWQIRRGFYRYYQMFSYDSLKRWSRLPNGCLEGPVTCWQNNICIYSVNYIDGQKDGPEEWRNLAGIKIQSTVWRLGKKEGRAEIFSDDGRLKISHVDYHNGQRHGISEGWYANGQQCYRILYVEGLCEGLSESWDENGHLLTQRLYVKDQVVAGD